MITVEYSGSALISLYVVFLCLLLCFKKTIYNICLILSICFISLSHHFTSHVDLYKNLGTYLNQYTSESLLLNVSASQSKGFNMTPFLKLKLKFHLTAFHNHFLPCTLRSYQGNDKRHVTWLWLQGSRNWNRQGQVQHSQLWIEPSELSFYRNYDANQTWHVLISYWGPTSRQIWDYAKVCGKNIVALPNKMYQSMSKVRSVQGERTCLPVLWQGHFQADFLRNLNFVNTFSEHKCWW